AARVAGRDQPQHVELARGQRLGALDPLHPGAALLHCAEEPVGQAGLQERAAVGQHADRRDELLEGDVREEVPAGAGTQHPDDELVVVEGGEDEHRQREVAVAELLEHRDAVPVRHAQVEEQDVDPAGRHECQRVLAVLPLGDDLDVVTQREQSDDALADQGLVVDDGDPDHGAGSTGRSGVPSGAGSGMPGCAGSAGFGCRAPGRRSMVRARGPSGVAAVRGSRTVTANPSPGPDSTATYPPRARTRSAMPCSPLPGTTTGAPRPSSRAWTVRVPASSWVTATSSRCAPERRSVLVATSCTARPTASATSWPGGSATSTSRPTARPGSSPRSSRSVSASCCGSSRRALTVSRTSVSSPLAMSRARVTWWAPSPAPRCPAISSSRASAVSWWPTPSCRSRAMRSRSASRLAAESRAVAARSSACAVRSSSLVARSRRCASSSSARAARSRSAPRMTTTANAWKEANAPVRASTAAPSAAVSTIPSATATDCSTTSVVTTPREKSEVQVPAVTTNRVAIQVSVGSRNHTASPAASSTSAPARSGSSGRRETSSDSAT